MAELADVPVRGEGKAAARMHSQMFERWQAVFSVLRTRALVVVPIQFAV